MRYQGEDIIRIGETVALLAAHTPKQGAHPGSQAVRVGSVDHFHDSLHYLVMTRGLHFQAEVLEGSAAKPFLSFVLQTPPGLVNEVLTPMYFRSPVLFHRERLSDFISEFKRRFGDTPRAYVERLQGTTSLPVAETASG